MSSPCVSLSTIDGNERAPLIFIEVSTTKKADRRSPCSSKLPGVTDATRKARKALTFAICFCFVFMIAEFAGGLYSHSLALLNDAAHMITDVGNLSLSLVALHASTWSFTDKYTYGWRRAEVVGALASVFTTWALVVWIMVEAVLRAVTIVQCASNPGGADCFAINASVMLYIGTAGFLANVACAFILHWGGHHGHSHGSLGGDHGHGDDDHHSDAGHSQKETVDCHVNEVDCHGHDHNSLVEHNGHHEEHKHTPLNHQPPSQQSEVKKSSNMNLRGAFLHVIGDCLQSLGVVVAAITIWVSSYKQNNSDQSSSNYFNLADPACSIMFGIITMFTTVGLFRDIFLILMEATPKGVHLDALQDSFLDIDGVVKVRDLHAWSLGSEHSVVTAHIVVNEGKYPVTHKVVRSIHKMLKSKFGISHCTIQARSEAHSDTDDDVVATCSGHH